MSDVAAPAAPAAPAAAPTNGAAPRNNAGQFSPKDGATGVTPPPKNGAAGQQTPAAPPPPKPEPWKVKLKLDNEEVELDEARATQEAKELRWRRKQQNEIQAMKREAEELVKLAQTDRRAFFKHLGVDLDAEAEARRAERERLAQLTPEQQELERAKAELEAVRKENQTERQRIAEAQKQAQRAQIQQRNREEYEAALGHSVLPHSRAKLFFMTQLQRGQKESGAPPFSPEQLGKAYDELMLGAFSEMVTSATTKPEALARLADLPKLAISSLEKLDGDTLLNALGPALSRKVGLATVARHRGQQTIPVPQGNGSQPTPPAKQQGGSIDEVQLEQRKRDFLKSYGG